MESAHRRYTTISIPQPLYEDIKKAIEGTGFRSPTEFLVYVTRLSLQSGLVRGESDAAQRSDPVTGHGRTTANPFQPAPRAVPYR
jgi:hypothetical protein